MESFNLEEIGKRVEEVRNRLGMTREELGTKLGIKSDAVYNLERARLKRFPEAQLKLIAAILGVDYEWLLTGKREMFPDENSKTSLIIENILEGEDETAKAVFRAFAKLSSEEWKLLDKIIDLIQSERRSGAQ